MTMTDPIADMLSRIRNAQAVKKETVLVPYSRIKESIAKILQTEGYIKDSQKVQAEKFHQLKISLKYNEDGLGVIESLQRVSKPGRRIYTDHQSIPRVLNGFGMVILSTPQGVISDKQAKKQRIGGEIICEIY